MAFEDILANDEIEESTDTTTDDNDLSGEEELFAAIKSLSESEDDADDDDDDENDDSDDETFDDSDDDDNESDDDDSNADDDEEEYTDTTDKKVQSKEENARFAAQRRQEELDRKVQAELDRLKQESPEFQLARQLSDMYGRPAQEIMAEMKEAALIKEAQEAKIPVDVLRKQRASDERADNLEQQLNQLRFEQWQSKIQADSAKLQSEYTMLNQEELDEAVNYILHTAQNVDMPLEQAVYALHGKKIIDSLAKAKVQDNLADQSGRKKKTPPSPNNGKASKVTTLTAEEAYIAKQFNMTADEYNKYK